MKLPLKVRFLNVLRRIWMVRPLESWLARQTVGRSPDDLLCKLVPNPHQYVSPSERVVTRNGIQMKVDISDYMGHYFFFGFDDPSNRALFSQVQDFSHVVDVGANIGWTALRMAGLAQKGWVMAFEPDPVNHQRCEGNVSLNGPANLRLFRVALGNESGTVTMEVRTPTNFGGNRIIPDGGDGREVEVRKLDDMVVEFPDSQVDLVKIDVEGYELQVLRGATQLIRRSKPRLFVELDDQNLRDQGSSAAELVKFLETMGYVHIQDSLTSLPVDSNKSFANCHMDILAY